LALVIYRPFCQLICPFGFVSWLAERLSLMRPDDLTVAVGYGDLARIMQKQGAFFRATGPFQEALAAMTRIYGPDHWRTRDASVALKEAKEIARHVPEVARGICDTRFGTLRSARLLEQGRFYDALEIAREDEEFLAFRAGGSVPSFHALCLANLATIHRAMGAYEKSVPIQRKALKMLREVYGEEHPDYIRTMQHQCESCRKLGDFARSEAAARRSVELARKVWGPEHGEYAVSLNYLVEACLHGGRLNEAEPLVLEALKTAEKDFRNYHVTWTTSLCYLAEIRRRRGQLDNAKKLLEHALANRRKASGSGHPLYLDTLATLAKVNYSLGNHLETEKQLRQVMETSKTGGGEKHPQHARYLATLARFHQTQGDHAEAEALLGQALEILRANLNLTFTVLSERQQLEMTRDAQGVLFAYLSSVLHLGQDAEPGYAHVLAWKGAVTLQQQRARQIADASKDDPMLKKLQETARRLATLALIRPTAEQRKSWQREIDELSQEKERLEGQLAERSGKIVKSYSAVTPQQLRDALPEDVALIDFIEYAGTLPKSKQEARRQRLLMAFVVRKGRDVVRVCLGPVAPIRALGDRWLRLIGGRGGGVVGPGRELRSQPSATDTAGEPPQAKLRAMLWRPLERHLEGAGKIAVSPDGVTASLPLAALPGRRPGKYLIEERAVVVLPVPGQLPQLLAARPGEQQTPSMMLLGDVDFGASPGRGEVPEDQLAALRPRSAPRDGEWKFLPLPGTGREATAIARLYRSQFADAPLEEFRGARATEEGFRTAAPKHRFLHLATHGFFAPPHLRSALARDGDEAPAATFSSAARPAVGLHPGLLSGLALAGANSGAKSAAAEGAAEQIGDDGVLTALEVASLDLRSVELAVLSACETGLGKTAAGEGVLGLQRAFQIAGADATVTSLWKVDDMATQALMVEFYRILWEKKLDKLEALRQAQAAMLERYDPRRHKLLPRGLRMVDREEAPETPTRLPPYYWAAFTISGDWR